MKNGSVVVAVAASIFMSGCHNATRVASDHEHEHEEKLQITAYSESLELFAEADPVIAGENVGFKTYITTLSDFKPVAEASVQVTLSVGGSKQTAQAQQRANGIYEFEITPDKAGVGTLSLEVWWNDASDVVTTPLEVFATDQEADEAIEESEPSSSNGVAFGKEKSWNIDFATQPVTEMSIGEIIRTVAQVQVLPERQTMAISASDGVIGYAVPGLTNGTPVRKGQILFTIEGNSTAGDGLSVRLTAAEADFNLAKGEYERMQSLSPLGAVSESDLQRARAEFERSQAVYESLSRNYADGKQVVKASADGYITALNVANGEYVTAGTRLAWVADVRRVALTAQVQPRYFRALDSIKGANISVGNGKTVSLEMLNGTMLSYGRALPQDASLLPVTFAVDNDGGLLPGSFVEMFIQTDGGKSMVCVPNGAIVEEMGCYFVFVQLTPEFFEKRLVETSATDGNYTQILSGVEQGERVVSRGAVMVKLSQSQGALDPHAGHSH